MRDSWELTPSTSSHWYIHAKSMVADNQNVVVSSFNLVITGNCTNTGNNRMAGDFRTINHLHLTYPWMASQNWQWIKFF